MNKVLLNNWLTHLFTAMIGFWVLCYALYKFQGYNNIYLGFFQFILCILSVAVFVLSIIHLRYIKEKGLAISSLVVSSIFILMIFIAFLVGVIMGIMEMV
jgi:hypothetical protein